MEWLIGCMIVILALFGIVARKGRDIFEPVVAIALLFILYFVIGPLSLLMGRSAFYPLSSSGIITMSLAGGVFGLLGFYIGYFSRLPNLIARQLPYIISTRVALLIPLLMFYLVVGLISAVFVIKLIGLQTVIHSPIEVARALNVGGGYLRLGLSTISVVLYTLFSLKMFQKGKSIPVILVWVVLLISFVFAGIQGVRGEFLRMGGILFVLWCYAHYKTPRLRSIFHFIPIIIVFIFVVLVLMNWFRIYGTFDWKLAMNLDVIYRLFCEVLRPFDWAAFVAEQLALTGKYLLCLPYLNLFIALIPRAIWPEKPIISLEYLFSRQFESSLPVGSTTTLTIPGELQLQIPFLGVLLGMAFFGLVLKVCYKYRNLHSDNWAANMIYSFVYIFTITAFFSSFMTWINVLILMGLVFLPVLLVGSIWRRPKRP